MKFYPIQSSPLKPPCNAKSCRRRIKSGVVMLFFVRATSKIHILSDCILHLLEQLSTGMNCLADWHCFTPYNFPNKMQSNATWFVFYQFGERIFHYDCGEFWRFLRTWGKNTFGWDAAKDAMPVSYFRLDDLMRRERGVPGQPLSWLPTSSADLHFVCVTCNSMWVEVGPWSVHHFWQLM